MPKWQKLKSLLKGTGWPARQQPAPYFTNNAVDYHVLDSLRPIRDDDVPNGDVVIATWWETAEWVNSLAERKGRKFYFIQGHEVFPYLPIERVKATYKLPLEKIVVSSWLTNILSSEYNCSNTKLVPNAVNIDFFNAQPRLKRLVPTVGFLLGNNPVKNTQIAIDAVIMAKKILPELRVISFGASQPSNTLRLPAWVNFVHRPAQEQIPQIYASCNSWLFTSESEGFGLPILEAMACRTPVIASRAGAAPDLINGQNGFLVDTNAEAFAEKIVAIAKMSNDDWRARSDAAYATAHSYSWDDATDLFEKALLL